MEMITILKLNFKFNHTTDILQSDAQSPYNIISCILNLECHLQQHTAAKAITLRMLQGLHCCFATVYSARIRITSIQFQLRHVCLTRRWHKQSCPRNVQCCCMLLSCMFRLCAKARNRPLFTYLILSNRARNRRNRNLKISKALLKR